MKKNNHREFISWLLTKWSSLCYYGALEKLQTKASMDSLQNALPPGITIDFGSGKPIMQIEIIKAKIIETLPETFFILSDFNDNTDLAPEDLLDLYVNHQQLSIQKVEELLNKLN